MWNAEDQWAPSSGRSLLAEQEGWGIGGVEQAGLRIALIVHQFLPHHAAGTEQLTLKVAQSLRARGIEVTVVAAEPVSGAEPAIKQDSVKGIPVIRLQGVTIGNPFISIDNPQADGLLRQVLKRLSPDLVHIFHFNHIGVGIVDVAATLGLPLLFTATDFWWRCPLEHLQGPDERRCQGPGLLGARCLQHRALIHFSGRSAGKAVIQSVPLLAYALPLAVARAVAPLLPIARRVAGLSRRQEDLRRYAQRIKIALAPTEAVRDEMVSAGFAPESVRLLPFGIDAPEEAAPAAAKHPFTIGFIGTLREHKGAHLLLEAAARLPAGLDARIQIYGDRSTDAAYAERLDMLARDALVPVTFEGAFAEDVFGRVLAGLDAVVVPSLWMENRPLVLLSSLLARKPVVVTDQPGLTCEVVHGENGLVVPPDRPEALAEALTRLALDTGLREHLARHPRRPMRMEAYIEALCAIYAEIALSAANE